MFRLPTHLKGDLLSILRVIDLVRISEYRCNLLESQMPGIREEDPCTNGKDVSWNNEAQVEFPADVSTETCQHFKQCRAVSYLRESSGGYLKPHDVHQRNCPHCNGHSLGTEVVWPHFTEIDVLGSIKEQLCESLP